MSFIYLFILLVVIKMCLKIAGSRGQEITTKRKRIKERTRELLQEFEACKKFITMNLSFREALEKEIRQLVMLRDTMQSRFKKWRHNLAYARERLARFEEELLGDDGENDDDEELNVNLDFAIEQIADEWDRLGAIVEESREEGIELERRVRLLTTTIVQLERYLMNRKVSFSLRLDLGNGREKSKNDTNA